MQSLAMMLTSLLPDILILAITVFQICKLEASVPFLVATLAANLKTCTRILISRLDDSSLEMLNEALLHGAIFHATCLAMVLRDKLHESLHHLTKV